MCEFPIPLAAVVKMSTFPSNNIRANHFNSTHLDLYSTLSLTHTHTHALTNTHTHTCMHAHIHSQTHTHTYLHTHTQTRTCTHPLTNRHIHTYIHTHTHPSLPSTNLHQPDVQMTVWQWRDTGVDPPRSSSFVLAIQQTPPAEGTPLWHQKHKTSMMSSDPVKWPQDSHCWHTLLQLLSKSFSRRIRNGKLSCCIKWHRISRSSDRTREN